MQNRRPTKIALSVRNIHAYVEQANGQPTNRTTGPILKLPLALDMFCFFDCSALSVYFPLVRFSIVCCCCCYPVFCSSVSVCLRAPHRNALLLLVFFIHRVSLAFDSRIPFNAWTHTMCFLFIHAFVSIVHQSFVELYASMLRVSAYRIRQ